MRLYQKLFIDKTNGFLYNTLCRKLQRIFIEIEDWNDLNITVNSDRAG